MNHTVGSSPPLAAEALRPQKSRKAQQISVGYSRELQLAVRKVGKIYGATLLNHIFFVSSTNYQKQMNDLVQLAKDSHNDSYFPRDDIFDYFVENGKILNKTKAELCMLFQDLPKNKCFKEFCKLLDPKLKILNLAISINGREFKYRLAQLLFKYAQILRYEGDEIMVPPVLFSTGTRPGTAKAYWAVLRAQIPIDKKALNQLKQVVDKAIDYNQKEIESARTRFLSTDSVSGQGIFARIKVPE